MTNPEQAPMASARKPLHPGEILRTDVLPELGISVTAAAEHLGVSRVALSRVLNGRAAISADLALRLAEWLPPTADSWLAMQAAHDLWRLRLKRRPRVRAAEFPAGRAAELFAQSAAIDADRSRPPQSESPPARESEEPSVVSQGDGADGGDLKASGLATPLHTPVGQQWSGVLVPALLDYERKRVAASLRALEHNGTDEVAAAYWRALMALFEDFKKLAAPLVWSDWEKVFLEIAADMKRADGRPRTKRMPLLREVMRKSLQPIKRGRKAKRTAAEEEQELADFEELRREAERKSGKSGKRCSDRRVLYSLRADEQFKPLHRRLSSEKYILQVINHYKKLRAKAKARGGSSIK